MLLRSQTRSEEYISLKQMLLAAGVYEDNLSLDEMRNFAEAINRSAMDEENASLQESYLDQLAPLEPNSDGILSSTVVEQQLEPQSHYGSRRRRRNASPFSSPEPNLPGRQVVVTAEVHHEAGWEPDPQPHQSSLLERKRTAEQEKTAVSSSSSKVFSSGTSEEDWTGPPSLKRALYINPGQCAADSGCSTQNTNESSFETISISIHSSLMGSSEPEIDVEVVDNVQSSEWYVHHNDCDTVMDFVKNNFVPDSSSEKIDLDIQNPSDYSH